MKILMLCYEFPPLGGGGSRVVHGLSKELARQGQQVDLVTMGFRGLPGVEQFNGLRVYRVSNLRIATYKCTVPEAACHLVLAVHKAKQLARRENYDVVHSHFILPDGLIAWLLNKQFHLDYVITAHGSDVPGYNPHRLKLAHKVVTPIWMRITQDAMQVVCPSRILQDLVIKHNGFARTVVIPYGFSATRFEIDGKRQKRILVVTRMLKRKGVQYLLEAVKGLALDHEIHIVGDGPYLPVLKRLANQTKTYIKFWGWLDNFSPELKQLFETSRIFVLTSEAENFPVALMEAMAAGLAIITTRDTGCAEVVGETAILVRAKEVNELRDALLRLTSDNNLCLRLGTGARHRIKEQFSWDAVAKQYMNLYVKQAVTSAAV
jgi:glycosyltransferase involved in cell wall biosynthesis